MASWKPSTVEDIQRWLRGEYVVNPTDKEWWQMILKRIRDVRRDAARDQAGQEDLPDTGQRRE